MTYADLLVNAVTLGLLALTIAKLNEAVLGRLYSMAFALFEVPDEIQTRIRSTLFLWALAAGIALCVRAQIPFMGDLLRTPDSYVVAGLVVGASAGLIWDLVLDPVPQR